MACKFPSTETTLQEIPKGLVISMVKHYNSLEEQSRRTSIDVDLDMIPPPAEACLPMIQPTVVTENASELNQGQGNVSKELSRNHQKKRSPQDRSQSKRNENVLVKGRSLCRGKGAELEKGASKKNKNQKPGKRERRNRQRSPLSQGEEDELEKGARKKNKNQKPGKRERRNRHRSPLSQGEEDELEKGARKKNKNQKPGKRERRNRQRSPLSQGEEDELEKGAIKKNRMQGKSGLKNRQGRCKEKDISLACLPSMLSIYSYMGMSYGKSTSPRKRKRKFGGPRIGTDWRKREIYQRKKIQQRR